MLYGVLMLPVLLAVGVLAVDVGRLRVAKGELQDAADAVARYAAAGMARSSMKSLTAYNQAIAACADEKVEGKSISRSASDVEVGVWNTSARTFTPTVTDPNVNAVRVTLTTTVGGPGSAPTFASAIGGGPRVIKAVSVAMATSVSYQFTAPTSGNIWLSGAADNTTITNLQNGVARYDSSGTASNPMQRPTTVPLTALGVQPGDSVNMEGLSGWGNNGGGASTYGPDGNLGRLVALGDGNAAAVPTTNCNGLSNMRAPISSFIAVFLNDNDPAGTSAPPNLDFGTAASRDYASISPQLKQTFFIGDGLRDNGELQTIKVPAGATRMYFGMMDAWQWNDNTGAYTMSLYRGMKVVTVK
jgi:Flp pilus assembly protein TadG